LLGTGWNKNGTTVKQKWARRRKTPQDGIAGGSKRKALFVYVKQKTKIKTRISDKKQGACQCWHAPCYFKNMGTSSAQENGP